jgi:hypothetical protein
MNWLQTGHYVMSKEQPPLPHGNVAGQLAHSSCDGFRTALPQMTERQSPEIRSTPRRCLARADEKLTAFFEPE